MTFSPLKSVSIVAVAAALTAGCASTGDVDSLRAEIQSAQAAAQQAQQTAQQANQTAQQALQVANEAKAMSTDTDERINRMFRQSMFK
ncbi:MAG: Lpp/OprI family alanine-zipper lipoprotein [Pseudomonadota bacterium]|nr:Lpp/OprI family alanine-zipper lipoprotein [Pseudomonadota bacterium]